MNLIIQYKITFHLLYVDSLDMKLLRNASETGLLYDTVKPVSSSFVSRLNPLAIMLFNVFFVLLAFRMIFSKKEGESVTTWIDISRPAEILKLCLIIHN